MVEARSYGGRSASERSSERRARFLDVGLELLGTGGLTAVTLRGVCKTANLSSRYFYESFADTDALTVAVYDSIVEEMIQLGLDRVAQAPSELSRQVNAGLRCAVDLFAADPRKGRVVLNLSLASPGLAERRRDTSERIAAIIANLGGDYLRPGADPGRLLTISRFFVGGFVELLTAWMADPAANCEELLDDCTQFFLSITADVLYSSPRARFGMAN
ncbi:TetR/AcrR family transcriptional regulator [Mycolicibacterium llatzerense]|uniref:TetR/AcrR family transcriptional regulator n=1 Tax=Mycolicibacterium llatzerense TaxID=280871 RepID=UPI0021B6465F|nr:TetR family transcriptional regulator [Mycolicibacterium llatzerense]MCT7363426.1 hypothetical protein [Mycolicibacterium llatzerense]